MSKQKHKPAAKALINFRSSVHDKYGKSKREGTTKLRKSSKKSWKNEEI